MQKTTIALKFSKGTLGRGREEGKQINKRVLLFAHK